MLLKVALILLLILVVPKVCEKLRIPSLIGLIVSGIAIGPHGLGLIGEDQTMEVLGNLGMLYVMFVSGIEINMNDLQQGKYKGMVFGLMTFLIPGVAGFVMSRYLCHFSLCSALLVAAMMGSHTLMTYPAVSRYGIQRSKAVPLVIGGTILATTVAMVILAGVGPLFYGSADVWLWVRLLCGGLAMVGVIFGAMPKLTDYCFRKFNEPGFEFVWVLLMAITAGLTAKLAGLEPILGVFLAGLALNRQIPNLSPLMHHISFVGNTIFIPIFLLSVGLLIDLRVFVQGWKALELAVLFAGTAVAGKFVAAWLAKQLFRLPEKEGMLVFGLTNAHAAGALATVMIGYNLFLPDGSRMMGADVLNATIILILLSSAISSFVTEHAAKHIALRQMHQPAPESSLRLLIPVANPQTNKKLVELASLLTTRQDEDSLHAMAVIRKTADRKQAEALLEETARHGAAADRSLELHTQVAVNISNGIRTVVEELQMTHVLAGMTEEDGYGKVITPLLDSCGQSLLICHTVQSLTNITSVRILAPEHAESEQGYNDWRRLMGGLIDRLQADMTQEVMTDWRVLPRIASSLSGNELLVVVQARHATLSYHPEMENTAAIMQQHFADKNYIVLYPTQAIGEQGGLFF